MNRVSLYAIAALGFVVFFSSCAPSVKPSGPTTNLPKPVWPSPPETARISFELSLTQPSDLGIKKGFFERFLELVVGEEDTRLIRPMAVAATAANVLYVADPGAKGVHRFDLSDNKYDLITRENGAPLPSPVGLASDGTGRAWVTDSVLGAIFLIEPGSKEALPLELDRPLKQPTGIALDTRGEHIFVVDTADHKINIFSLDGRMAGSFGSRGAADGQFNYPTMIWIDEQNRLLVTDSLNFRVQIFDKEGNFLSKFGRLGDGSGDLSRPKGIASDTYGHIYIVDALFHSLQIFDSNGRLLLNIGEQGRNFGEFWLPAGVFVSPDGRIYVADAYNSRVQVFRYLGETL
ncbi:MAG: hypothetical protein AB2805_05695 [Candidatus Thiodiazotropha sp.]